MIQAYLDGKDLYAVIAQSMFNNEYWENLEFYKEFMEVDVGGTRVVAGSDKTVTYSLDSENSITVPWCYILDTSRGKVSADALTTGDCVETESNGFLEILSIQSVEPTVIDGTIVKNIKIIFKNETKV